jgi:hypothetical protein
MSASEARTMAYWKYKVTIYGFDSRQRGKRIVAYTRDVGEDLAEDVR